MPTRPSCFGKYFHSQAVECRYECHSPTLCCGQTRQMLASEYNPYKEKSPAWIAYSIIMTTNSYPCSREELQRAVMAKGRECSETINEKTARWAVNRVLRGLFKQGMVSVIPAQVSVDVRVGAVDSSIREPE